MFLRSSGAKPKTRLTKNPWKRGFLCPTSICTSSVWNNISVTYTWLNEANIFSDVITHGYVLVGLSDQNLRSANERKRLPTKNTPLSFGSLYSQEYLWHFNFWCLYPRSIFTLEANFSVLFSALVRSGKELLSVLDESVFLQDGGVLTEKNFTRRPNLPFWAAGVLVKNTSYQADVCVSIQVPRVFCEDRKHGQVPRHRLDDFNHEIAQLCHSVRTNTISPIMAGRPDNRLQGCSVPLAGLS